jgi:hypothetical protein
MRFGHFGLLLSFLTSAIAATSCGAGTRHQATTSADPPRAAADAGASSPLAIVDAGLLAARTEVDAGHEMALANDGAVDAGPPKPTHPQVHISGKCVDALADAKARAKLPPGADLSIDPERADLDGDGVDDIIYTTRADTEFSGNGYITRGTCAVMVLAWSGSRPIPLETSTLGFLDLEQESICTPGCCATRTVTSYKWNGSVYLKGKPRVVKHECAFGGRP